MTLSQYSFLIVEHAHPLLHEESLEMMGCLALHLRADLPEDHGPASAPWALTCRMVEVFCFYEMPKASMKRRAKSGVFLGSQITQEAYS